MSDPLLICKTDNNSWTHLAVQVNYRQIALYLDSQVEVAAERRGGKARG